MGKTRQKTRTLHHTLKMGVKSSTKMKKYHEWDEDFVNDESGEVITVHRKVKI